MQERATSIIAIALLLALVFGTWWAANYAQQSIPVDPPRRVTHEANSWAKNFVMVRTDEKGIAINRLEGKYLQHFPDDDSYKITTAKAISQQPDTPIRSEEHTSELQSLMRISYAVFCLKKKKPNN